MSFNFPLILLVLVVFSGVVLLIDGCFMLWRRRLGVAPRSELPPVIDYARAFFPILFIVFVIRSFIVQPFRVPTGSLSPTILPGDMIIVTQYNYGLYWPVWDSVMVPVGHPKRGQIALFRYPVNPIVPFVKRVVGVPGDEISYIDKVFYINGKPCPQTYLGEAKEFASDGSYQVVKVYEENLEGIKHKIYRNPARSVPNFYNVKVPEGQYMMVGDNRDNSDDSRSWGFVDQDAFIGQAHFIWMSWNSHADLLHKIRWNRIGNGLQQLPQDIKQDAQPSAD